MGLDRDHALLKARGAWIRLASFGRRQRLRVLGVQVHPSVRVGRSVEIVGRGTRITVGAGSVIEARCRLTVSMAPHGEGASLTIGQRVLVGAGTRITCHQEVLVSDDVLIAAGCYITEANHGIAAGKLIRDQPQTFAPVRIEAGSWLGAHSVVAPGVTVGEGAVVGAGSVVTKDVPAGSVVAGVPARFIRYRD